ncbi:hypothetical protein FGO68_gene5151 [Halteria grandinella]|uniref:Uncharacterized protein n=1 Tax=Halteria grandinella TaxID=5974 RepID=A0A8J8P4I9_HALGN|nr:hypothetical protein FGO68_gene5151 [Halteria grandinella]
MQQLPQYNPQMLSPYTSQLALPSQQQPYMSQESMGIASSQQPFYSNQQLPSSYGGMPSSIISSNQDPYFMMGVNGGQDPYAYQQQMLIDQQYQQQPGYGYDQLPYPPYTHQVQLQAQGGVPHTSHSSMRGSLNISGGPHQAHHGRHLYRNLESTETTLPGSNNLLGLAAPGTSQALLQEMQMVGQVGHNNNDLDRLDSMERKLSNALDNGDQHQNLETMFQLYSDVINNAELASNQIKANDPLKKQWYKKVLQYQMKEKDYRKRIEVKRQKAQEEAQRRAEDAKAEAEKNAIAMAQALAQQQQAQEQQHMNNQRENQIPHGTSPGGGANGQVTFYPGYGGAQEGGNQNNPQLYHEQGNPNMDQRVGFRGPTNGAGYDVDPYYAQTGNFPNGQYQAQNYPYGGGNQQNIPYGMSAQDVLTQQYMEQAKQMFSAINDIIADTFKDAKKNVFDLSDIGGSSGGAGAHSFSEMNNQMMNQSQGSLRDPRYRKQGDNHFQNHHNPHDDVKVGNTQNHSLQDYRLPMQHVYDPENQVIKKKDSFPAQPGKSIQELMLEKAEHQANKIKPNHSNRRGKEEVHHHHSEETKHPNKGQVGGGHHSSGDVRRQVFRDPHDEKPVGGKHAGGNHASQPMHKSESLRNVAGHHKGQDQSIVSKSSLPGYSKWEAVNGPMSHQGGRHMDSRTGRINEEEHEDGSPHRHQRNQPQPIHHHHAVSDQYLNDHHENLSNHNPIKSIAETEMPHYRGEHNFDHREFQSDYQRQTSKGSRVEIEQFQRNPEERPLDVYQENKVGPPIPKPSREEKNQHPLGRKPPPPILSNRSHKSGKGLIHPLGRKLEAPPRNVQSTINQESSQQVSQMQPPGQMRETFQDPNMGNYNEQRHQLEDSPLFKKGDTGKGGPGTLEASAILAEFQEHFDKEGNFRQPNNLSMEMNNKMMTEEEYRAMRREKMKLNHLKRLQTQNQSQNTDVGRQQHNNQDEYPTEQKRAESPFLSQHTFAQELMQDDRRALSRDGPAGPSQPFTTARHSYSQAPKGELPLGGLRIPPSEFTQTPIVSQTRQPHANQFARDPRQNIPRHEAMPLNPINIEKILQTLPSEIANDADIKEQVRSLAEKQMKLLQQYKEDMDRITKIQEQEAAERSKAKEEPIPKAPPQKRPWESGSDKVQQQEQQKPTPLIQKRPWDKPGEAMPIAPSSLPQKHQGEPNKQEAINHMRKRDSRPYAVTSSDQEGERLPPRKIDNKRLSELGHGPVKTNRQKSTTASEGPYEIYDDERQHIHRKEQLETSTDVFNKPILPKPKGGYKAPPIPLRQYVGGKNFTDLLAPSHDALFIVQEMATLPKPQNSHKKLNALSEQDKAPIDDMFEIMHKNREFESIVIRDLWWKNFDSMTEPQRIATVSALIEQYFNHLKQHNHDAFQVPVLSMSEIHTKLRSLATQIVDTAAVHNLVKCTSEDQLFQGIEDAMGEIGLPDMVHFIRQELAMQASLRFQVLTEDNKGVPIRPTGALPRSLQMMSSPIKEKHEIHYHQELKDESKYPEVPNYNQEEFEKQMHRLKTNQSDQNDSRGFQQHERMEEYERERIVNQFNRTVRTEAQQQQSDNNIGEPDEEFVDAYQEAINYQIQREKQFLERDLEQITPPESGREDIQERKYRVASPVKHHHGHMLSVEDIHPKPQSKHASPYLLSANRHAPHYSARSRDGSPLNIFTDETGVASQREAHQIGATAEAINDIIDNYISNAAPETNNEEVDRIKVQVAHRISQFVSQEAIRASQESQQSANIFHQHLGQRISQMVSGKQMQEIKMRMSRIIAQELKPLEQMVPAVATQQQEQSEEESDRETSERNPIEMEGTSSRASSKPSKKSKKGRASDLQEDITNKVMDQLTMILEQNNESHSKDITGLGMNSLEIPRTSKGGARPSFLSRILQQDLDYKHPRESSRHSRRSHSNKNSDSNQSSVLPDIQQHKPHQFSLFAINPSRSRAAQPNFVSKTLSSHYQASHELPPIPRATFKPPAETESDKRLSKAIQKHVQKLEVENLYELKTPYQVFEEQYFNTLKDEVQGKYFVTNEEKYRDFNFNGDNLSEMERRFRIKDEILRREGVTKERVPDAKKLLEKIKSFKNPFINELFLNENPSTPSEQYQEERIASQRRSEEQAQQLNEQIQQYHEEFESIRNELMGMIEEPQVLHNEEAVQQVKKPSEPQSHASQRSIKQSFAILNKEHSMKSEQRPPSESAQLVFTQLPPLQTRNTTGTVQKADTKKSIPRSISQKSGDDIILHIKSLNSEQIQNNPASRQQSLGPKPAAHLSFLDQDIVAPKPRQSIVTLKVQSDQHNKSASGSVKRSESGPRQQMSFNPLNKNEISFKASLIEQSAAPVQFQPFPINDAEIKFGGLGSAKNANDSKLNLALFGAGEGSLLVPSTVKNADTKTALNSKANVNFAGVAEVQMFEKNQLEDTPEQVRQFMKRESLDSDVRLTINQTSLDANSYQLQIPARNKMTNMVVDGNSPARSFMQSVNFQSDLAPPTSDASTTYKEVWSQDSFTQSHRPPAFPLQPFSVPMRGEDVPSIQVEFTPDQLRIYNNHQGNLLTPTAKTDKKPMASRKLSINNANNKAEALHNENTLTRKQQTYVQKKVDDASNIEKEYDNNSHSNLSFGGAAVLLGLQGKVGTHLLKTMATYKSTFTLGAANR